MNKSVYGYLALWCHISLLINGDHGNLILSLSFKINFEYMCKLSTYHLTMATKKTLWGLWCHNVLVAKFDALFNLIKSRGDYKCYFTANLSQNSFLYSQRSKIKKCRWNNNYAKYEETAKTFFKLWIGQPRWKWKW